MGDWFGGGGEEEQPQQQYQEPVYYYPTTPAAPMYNPYQQYTGGGDAGASQLLGGTTVPSVNSPGFVPTGGWSGSGNAMNIPGAAAQLLRMRNSPQYLWQ